MWCYIQRHLTQFEQAPALDEVQVKYPTGSVKHSSAVLANCTLCRQRRHVRMWVPSKFICRYTNIKSHSVKAARNNSNLSLFRSKQK